MDAIDVVSIDNPPWPFNQFPVGEDIHRSQLGNDAAAFRQCGEGLTTPLQSRERGESVRRILLGNELDDSARGRVSPRLSTGPGNQPSVGAVKRALRSANTRSWAIVRPRATSASPCTMSFSISSAFWRRWYTR